MGHSAVRLVMVTTDNNNKFYNMTDNNDGKITVSRGRVGVTAIAESHPISKWDSLYKSKIKKGYKDVTHLFTETVNSTAVSAAGKVSFSDISDRLIASLIDKLQSYTKTQVAANYKVSADAVSERQIREAQNLLNALTKVKSNRELNELLLEIFAIIPRKMAKVREHLYEEGADFKLSIVEEVIAKEQELLDSMGQQVKQVELVNENTSNQLTLLDAMGIEIFNVRKDQEDMLKGKLASLSGNYLNGFRVENKKTQKKFQDFISKRPNKKTELFFHGSRNENWLPILQSGLVLRPTSAVITGKMFGVGTYFADKAQKSWGYTSARGSYWAKGSANEAYMALYEVHTGNHLHVKRHESWMGQLDERKLKAKGDYDSLYAEGGVDLRNSEYIVYHEDQSTVKYLLQMKG